MPKKVMIADGNDLESIQVIQNEELEYSNSQSSDDIKEEENKKKKKQKKKQKKKKKGEDEDEDSDGGGFVLSPEEAKIRDMNQELTPEEKLIHAKHKSDPSITDHFLFSPILRIMYVVLICLSVGLLVPYILSSFAFQRNESLKIIGDCFINSSYKFPCLSEFENVNETICQDFGCCYDDSDEAINNFIPKCYHRIPSSYVYESIGLNESFETEAFSIHEKSPVLLETQTPLPSFQYRLGNKSRIEVYLQSRNVSTSYLTKMWPVKVLIERKNCDVLRVQVLSTNDEGNPYQEPFQSQSCENSNLDVFLEQYDFYGFSITVVRMNGTEVSHNIFETYFGPLQYGENYVEITSKIPSSYIYGLGQKDSLNFDPSFSTWETWPLMSQEWQGQQNVLPFYFLREPSVQFHGVLLKNSGPIEIGVLPSPSLVFRSLQGQLDFRFLGGPTPVEVSKQLAEEVGYPAFPPYWSLGLHLCRSTTEKNNLKTYRKVEEDMNTNFIPYESDCINGRISYPDSFSSFTSRIVKEIEKLKLSGRKFILVAQPFLLNGTEQYNEANIENILVKLPDDVSYFGEIDKQTVAYPDFLDENVLSWLSQNDDIKQRYSIADGVFLFKNSPLNEARTNFTATKNISFNECTDNTTELCCPPDHLHYQPSGLPKHITDRTICWVARHATINSSHLSVHNAYGAFHMQRISEFFQTLTAKDFRQFLTSSSVHLGSGRIGGFLPEGYKPDFVSQQKSLTSILITGLNGLPMAGTPICGSIDNAKETLRPEWCLRAYQNAVFMPLAVSYYEEDATPRNPSVSGNFTLPFILNIRTYIRLRYQMLPHIYTLMRIATKTGVPPVRPLFYEFPEDEGSLLVANQFMSGSGILVSPVFTSDTGAGSQVQPYFPPGCWYDFFSGHLLINDSTNGTTLNLEILQMEMLIHIRGGYTLTMQGYLNNDSLKMTTDWRKQPYTFIVAYSNCDQQSEKTAIGYLYVDNGVSTEETLTVSKNYVHIYVQANSSGVYINTKGKYCDPDTSSVINQLILYGSPSIDVDTVTLNGRPLADVSINSETNSVFIYNLAADWCNEPTIQINWNLSY